MSLPLLRYPFTTMVLPSINRSVSSCFRRIYAPCYLTWPWSMAWALVLVFFHVSRFWIHAVIYPGFCLLFMASNWDGFHMPEHNCSTRASQECHCARWGQAQCRAEVCNSRRTLIYTITSSSWFEERCRIKVRRLISHHIGKIFSSSYWFYACSEQVQDYQIPYLNSL